MFLKPTLSILVYLLMGSSIWAQEDLLYRPADGVTIYGRMSVLESSPLVADFRNNGRKALSNLESMGINSIDGNDIKDIRTRFESIKIEFAIDIQYQSASDVSSRDTAYWNKKLNTIFINERHWKKLEDRIKEAMALHEIFGVMGIADNNFGRSSLYSSSELLKSLRAKQPQIFQEKPLLQLKKSIQDDSIFQLNGGVTGVGSGGDPRLIDYKEALILEAVGSLQFGQDGIPVSEEEFAAVIAMYSWIQIEFSSVIEQGTYLWLNGGRKLLIPKNALAKENLNLNQKAIIKINEDVFRLVRSGFRQ